MAQDYPYSITDDFPNQKVNLDSLTGEITASAIVTALKYIRVSGDACVIWFVTALSAEDKALLDGIVAAHQGDPPVTVEFKVPSRIIENTKEVTEDQTWETLGGTATTLAAFIPDVTKAWGRLIGQCLVSGDGAQLRVIRDSDDVVCGGPFSIADTESAWAPLQEWVNQNQPEGFDCYLLQGRLNGATSMQIRYVTISLFEKSP